eukprot:TRINITY_DN12638_c0_g3_i2.p1 TRINITY_DN12638_c0_g3~~TRINITY_DN12638_c0_g3_i2.p1  ORF type:complete len:932 (-),score=236.49 TRINITY_DN12638_c0_g3_i2:414-3209(-)
MLSMRQALGRLIHRQLSAAFQTWVAFHRDLHYTRHSARSAVARWANNQLVWALSMWRYGCILGQEAETMHQWVCRHWRMREIDWALRLWRFTTDQGNRVKYALARMANKAATMALNKWREYAWECREAAHTAHRALFFMKNRQYCAAWNSWRAQYVGLIRTRDLAQRSMARFVHNALSRALDTWRDNTTGLASNSTAVFWALSHWTLAAAGQALNQWRSVAEGLREQCRLMRRGIQRLICSKLAAACFTWRDVAASQREQQALLKKALGRLVHRQLSASFATWRDEFAIACEQQRLLRYALMRMVYRKLAHSITTWRDQTAVAIAEQRNAQNALMRFINQALTAGLNSWCSWYADILKQREAMHKALCKLINHKVTTALNTWFAWHQAVVSQRNLVGKAVRYLRSQKLAQAWEAWRYCYGNSFDNMSTQMRALFCWTHQVLSAAFNTWINATTQASAQKKLMQWAAARFAHLKLAVGFNTWSDYHQSILQQKAVMTKAAHFLGATEQSRLYVKSTNMFNTWRYGSSEHSVREALLVKAIITWQHQQLAMALRSWRIESAIGVGMKNLYTWVSYHWIHREKQWAFNMLRHSQEHGRVGLRAALYWANTQLHQAFDTWRAIVAHKRRKLQKSSIGKCLKHWVYRKLSAAFNTWHSKAMKILVQRQQLHRAACSWSRQGAVKAFNTWRLETMHQLDAIEKVYKAMFKWAHSSLSAAFNTWLSKAQDERMGDMIDIATQHYRYASIFVVLDHWRDVTNAVVGAMDVGLHDEYKADSHLRYSILRGGFDSWAEVWRYGDRSPVTVDQTKPSNVLAQACHPYGMFEVSITGTMYGKADRNLYYTVQVRFAAGQSYKLEKRYRDFDQLNTTLTERFASVLRGGAAMFPPKKPFTKLNPEFYESRVGDLHTFMQDVIAHSEVAASGEMCEFLKFQDHYY